MKHFNHYINGEFSPGSEHFESTNPANGEPWATFPAATESESNHAIRSANKALFEGEWASLTATDRGKLLRKLGDLIAQNSAALGELETTDSGKLAAETTAQSRYVADYYYYYAGLADKIQGEVLPIDKPEMHSYFFQQQKSLQLSQLATPLLLRPLNKRQPLYLNSPNWLTRQVFHQG